ncbi:molybdopterin molybdenumtransferase MoeA [Candidatus Bathyarchaeota archaeon]|nr:molybdopterin molybdenumtransferase MoeA [Candidatus Bathyarchaeota archaeon]
MKEVRMRGFMEHTRVEDALNEYLNKLQFERLQPEEIPIAESLGRVLAEDVESALDVPHFNRSAVDGYAVRSKDTYGTAPTNPVVFDLVGSVEIGQIPTISVSKLEAVEIATGAPLPKGADSVVMLEYTERIGKDRIEIHRPVTPWSNVSKRGEDVERGEGVLERGTVLQPQDLGILTAIGATNVRVVRKPRVAILSTGNELVESGSKVELGKVVDVNRVTISAAVEDAGGVPVDLGIVRDKSSDLKSRISEGLRTSDMVLVSGGTSVGTRDLVPKVVDSLGEPGIVVHGISMRPGKPTALAAIDGKPVILLPGYPVAAIIAFNTFVKVVMARMLGTSIGGICGQKIQARMLRRVPSKPGIRDYVRVLVKRTETGYVAEPIRTTGAGIISSLVKANGLIVILEENEGLEKGEEVEVTLLRSLEE